MPKQPSIAIDGIWLRAEGNHIVVDVQIGDDLFEVIRELNDGPISHFVYSAGIKRYKLSTMAKNNVDQGG
jgi:hypothetical protein